MTTYLDQLKQDIDRRLDELRPQIEEIPRLEAALAALESVGAGGGEAANAPPAAPPVQARRGPGRPRGSGGAAASGGRRAGRRAGRGQRRQEFLQLVKGSPDVSVSEAARQMGVSPSQVSNLARKLQDEGALAREPSGRWIFVGPAASAPEAPAHDVALAADPAARGGGGQEPPADNGDLATDEGVNEGTDEMVRESPGIAEPPEPDERPGAPAPPPNRDAAAGGLGRGPAGEPPAQPSVDPYRPPGL